MGVKAFLGFLFFLLVVGLLLVYWFIPLEKIDFKPDYGTSDFLVENLTQEDMQFYPNMRFINPSISYQIFDCPPQKRQRMEDAFKIIQGLTVLSFYPVSGGEQIQVRCEYTDRVRGDIFIAGEGGPINVTPSGDFYIIEGGEILLIRDSGCFTPNVAIHELLHVLGFKHSPNPQKIMYNFSDCDQEIGDDIPSVINTLYNFPRKPDLVLQNVSASLKGVVLSLNLTVWNHGLASSGEARVAFYTNDKEIGDFDLPVLDIGQGSKISWQKTVLLKNFESVIVKIIYSGDELKTDNNRVELKIKE